MTSTMTDQRDSEIRVLSDEEIEAVSGGSDTGNNLVAIGLAYATFSYAEGAVGGVFAGSVIAGVGLGMNIIGDLGRNGFISY